MKARVVLNNCNVIFGKESTIFICGKDLRFRVTSSKVAIDGQIECKNRERVNEVLRVFGEAWKCHLKMKAKIEVKQ